MTRRGHSTEAIWWSLFSAGGVLAALFIPALMIVTGPWSVWAGKTRGEESVRAALVERVSAWPVRVVLMMVLTMSFFHCAHRIRHVLIDLGARGFGVAISLVCYSGAVVGSGVAGYLLWNLS